MTMDTDGPSGKKRRSKSADKVASKPGRPAFSFTNLPLTDSDKERIKSEVETPERILDWVREMAFDGYRVGVTHDSNSDAFNVAFTGIYEGRSDDNRCVTSRAALLEVAFTIAIFKWNVYCEFGIPAQGELGAGREVFD